jgi:hypothetical protein
MLDVGDGEVGEEDGGVVGRKEESSEGTLRVELDAGVLKGKAC